jgi:putative flippase GtrA
MNLRGKFAKYYALYGKHKETINYLFFGGLTTVVGFVSYVLLCLAMPGIGTTVPNVISWIIAVLFAYFTNRKWVFESKTEGLSARLREFGSFCLARVATLVVETLLLWLLVDTLRFPNLLIKLFTTLFQIVANYVLSKFLVFRKARK